MHKERSIQQVLNREDILEGIARGEVAILANRILSNAQAKEKMSKWL